MLLGKLMLKYLLHLFFLRIFAITFFAEKNEKNVIPPNWIELWAAAKIPEKTIIKGRSGKMVL